MTANPAPEDRPRAVILVEGMSDRIALEVLARRRGRDLAAQGVAVIAMHGATNLGHYLDPLWTLQHQPAQLGRSTQDQLRRFMSGRSGNKHRYARLLAGAMELDRVPRPLDGVLGHV
jgi:DNA-binding LacI/PurR family transcriptional regulator